MVLAADKTKTRTSEYHRSSYDRRSEVDRRKAYKLGYFLEGGTERRKNGKDRRHQDERRKDWIRASEWSSFWKGFVDLQHYRAD